MPEQGTLAFGDPPPVGPGGGVDGRTGRRVLLTPYPRQVLPDLLTPRPAGADGARRDGAGVAGPAASPAPFDAVLAPNRHAGDALRGALGLSERPRSIESFATRVLRATPGAGAALRPASALQERRLLRDAVRAVVGPDDLEGTVRTWGPTVREVLRAGFGSGPEPTLDASSPRARQVLDVAARYRELLRDGGLLDAAELMWVASERVRAVPAASPTAAEAHAAVRKCVLVAGYPRVGLGELAFLDAVAADGSVVVLPSPGGDAAYLANEDAASYLAARGWTVERPLAAPARGGERWSARLAGASEDAPDPPASEARGLRFPDQEAEVRGVLADVKDGLLRGVAPDAIALIARDEALYGPLMRAVALEYGVPVRLSYAAPLRESRVGAWLADLLECVRDRFPFEPTARLLAHPLCDRLDGDRWARARATHPHGLEAWTALVPEAAVLEGPRRAERAAHLAWLDRVLADLGVGDALAQADKLSADALAGNRIRLALRELRTEAGPVPRETFLAELEDALSALTVPLGAPAGAGDGTAAASVALHTPLAVYGARFEHVYLLGMAEGVTPAPVRDDPVLDFAERARLRAVGVPVESAAEAAERELLSFWAALETADARVTLSHPELVGGSERVPSPFFERLGLAPRAAPPHPPASRMEARAAWLRGGEDEAAAARAGEDTAALPRAGEDGPEASEVAPRAAAGDEVLPFARAAWRVERRREGAAPWDAFDGVVGVPLDPDGWPFSASQLTSLGQCAFRWFAQRRLRLAPLEEAEEEVSPLLRGRLYHEALAICLEHARHADDPRAAALEHLEDAFAKAEETVGVPAQASWPIRRPYHLEVLRRVLRADDFWPADGRIVALEQRFRGTWRGLRVTGFVDRVDGGPDGLVLLDYKTRATRPDGAKDRAGKARLDVQLPLYVEAAAPALYPGEPVADARYYSLTKARTLTRATVDDDELTAFVERVREHLRQGSYPVDPDVDARACAHCDFDAVCRRGARLERKRQGGAE